MQESDVFFLTNNNKTLSSVYEQNCPAEALVPQGVERIEKRAFADCPVNRLTLPDSVTEIGYEAFAGCDALQFVHLPKNLKVVEGGIFRGCLSLEKIEMSDTIKSFSESMFESCASLQEIPFRNGILELPRNVFSECSSLKSATIPPSVAAIRSGAFGYCENLQTVVLPAGLKLIEDDAFRNCASLSHIRFADDNPAFFVDDDGCLFARRDDSCLTLIKVPVTAREITIPQNVVQAHSEAFQGCDALETVYIDCPLVEHPIFVALKTEVVAEIVDTSSEEYQEALAAKEKAEAEAVSSEEIFDEEDGGVEESILDDIEDGKEEEASEEEAAEPEEEAAEESESKDDLLSDIMGQSGAIPEEEPAEEPSAEEAPKDDLLADIMGQSGAIPQEENNEASSDDLLSDIMGQQAEQEEDADDELANVRITPEELDEAVMRGIQEEDEAEKQAKIADARAHANDDSPAPEEEEEEVVEVQEPRFVYGMESVSQAFEVVSESELYPDRPKEELDQHQPNELEDITTLVVVTEKVTDEKNVSAAVKNFCLELAKAHELKRVYFFGGLGLDNDEFLFGFGKFAMYRNVVYAALASDENSLSKEIKNFAEIAELQSPVAPFQRADAENALELEKPFKVFIQDVLGGEPGAAAESPVQEPVPEPIVEEAAVEEPLAEEGHDIPGQGLMAKALWILGNKQ